MELVRQETVESSRRWQRRGRRGEKKKSINLPPQMEITVLSSHHLTSLFSADELALRSRVKFQDGEKNK